MKAIFYFFQYIFYRAIVALINWIPFNLALRVANKLGKFILCRNKRRMEMTRQNLKRAFGDQKSDEEIRGMISEVNGRLFEIAIEFLRIPKLAKNPQKHLPRVNPEYIWNALKEKKGAILLVSHLGNWEILANGGGAEGYPIHAVGKQSPNPYIDAFIQKIRGVTGLKTIKKIGAIKDVGNLLKENQVVCLPMDQRVKGGEPVQFLGQTAYLSSLPVLLAIRYGTPVIPCFVYREPGAKYLITATPPLTLIEKKDLREALHINTQKFAERIEEEILKNPTDWVLWRQNIWKD